LAYVLDLSISENIFSSFRGKEAILGQPPREKLPGAIKIQGLTGDRNDIYREF